MAWLNSALVARLWTPCFDMVVVKNRGVLARIGLNDVAGVVVLVSRVDVSSVRRKAADAEDINSSK